MLIVLNILLSLVAAVLVLWFLPVSLLLLLGLIVLMLYFLPSYIAFKKQHPNRIALLIINLFLGFTLVVWLICLILAITYTPTVKIVEHHYHHSS